MHPNVVQEYLDHPWPRMCHEITDHSEVHVSRFGDDPKKHQPNNGIDKQLCSMKYAERRQWYAAARVTEV